RSTTDIHAREGEPARLSHPVTPAVPSDCPAAMTGRWTHRPPDSRTLAVHAPRFCTRARRIFHTTLAATSTYRGHGRCLQPARHESDQVRIHCGKRSAQTRQPVARLLISSAGEN